MGTNFHNLLRGLISRQPVFPYHAVSQSEVVELANPDLDVTPDISLEKEDTVPYPTQQIICLLILALAEPIQVSQKSPNIPQLIEDLGIIGDDKSKVGYYSGLIDTVYFCTEGIFILQWARVSDRIGRKPVLLIGVVGLALSSIFFGLSKTFLGVLISNSLAGVLNANWALTRSAMADVLDSPQFTRTIAWQPAIWSAGSVVGSLFGGALSHPYEKYPSIFGSNNLWQKYPYLLPSLVSATISGIIFILGFFRFKETLPKNHRHGLESLPHSDDRGEYELLETRNNSVANRVLITNVPGPLSRPSLRALLTRPMIIILINYGIFCIHDITVSSIVPLFLAAPLKAGGLALSTGQIGFCLAMISFYNSVFQIFVFARMESRWGSKKLARGGMITMAVIYLIFPIHAWMAKSGSLGFMTWLLLLIQCTVLPFGLVGVTCFAILLTAATPPSSYGAANGLMQSSAAVVRMVAPVGVTYLFALSIERNIAGGNFIYYFVTIMAFLGYYGASYLVSEGVQRQT